MRLEYTILPGGARIDKITDPEARVIVPEKLEGLPVVELGAYALSGSAVEILHLPSGLRRIGAYAFYNCERLRQIYCFSQAADLGTGLFAGAGRIGFLDITLIPGEKSCFKEMLSELRQTLRVQLHGTEEARLIFPEYFEESVENTPARILYYETHGCGHRYRYCFARTQFQYPAYDELFAHVQVQEPEALVTELALGRLLYPAGLTERFRGQYQAYAAEHWHMAVQLLVAADGCHAGSDGDYSWSAGGNLDAGCLPWFVEEICRPGAEQLSEMIAIARRGGDTEMVSWLMNYRNQQRQNLQCTDGERRRKRRFELL